MSEYVKLLDATQQQLNEKIYFKILNCKGNTQNQANFVEQWGKTDY